MDLADYERRKFEFAEILRAIAVLEPKADGGGSDEIRAQFARLAEDRFNLAVVGRFSRGKSSLMNAILGMDRLPTGIVPLTSVITSVSYGSEECVVLSYEGSLLRREIRLEDLPLFVTQEGNPGNVQGLRLAEIQLPAEILRRGFYFIDTPGLGSATLENTRTTEAFLPAADGFLLVTGYEGPLSEEEFNFLRWAHSTSRRIFVAVNKHDTVGPKEREQALGYVRDQLRAMFGEGGPEVFSTSATEALKAKADHDGPGLADSGVEALEQALISFLVREKSREFLLRMCERVERVLWGLLLSTASKDLGARILEMRVQLGGDVAETGALSAVGGLAPVKSESADACEICRAIEEAIFTFLSNFQYDITVSEAEQDKLAQTGGLCALHTWWYHRLASPQGTSVAYPRLMEHWVSELAALAADPQMSPMEAAGRVEDRLPAPGSCPVCAACAAAEAEALVKAAGRLQAMGDPGLDGLSAICLRHLPGLLRLIEFDETARGLLRRQAGLFERVAEDMRRYAMKRDALRRNLASRAEDGSGARGLKLLVGQPNVSFAKPVE